MQANRQRLLGKRIDNAAESNLGVAQRRLPCPPVGDVDANEKIGRRTWETDDVVRSIANRFGDRRGRRRFAQDQRGRSRSARAPRIA